MYFFVTGSLFTALLAASTSLPALAGAHPGICCSTSDVAIPTPGVTYKYDDSTDAIHAAPDGKLTLGKTSTYPGYHEIPLPADQAWFRYPMGVFQVNRSDLFRRIQSIHHVSLPGEKAVAVEVQRYEDMVTHVRDEAGTYHIRRKGKLLDLWGRADGQLIVRYSDYTWGQLYGVHGFIWNPSPKDECRIPVAVKASKAVWQFGADTPTSSTYHSVWYSLTTHGLYLNNSANNFVTESGPSPENFWSDGKILNLQD